MSDIHIRAVRFDSPTAQRLITAALHDLSQRYGGDGDETPIDPNQFVRPHGDFLIALLDEEPVGCAGWRTHGDDAELKRMYTAPQARGRGVARQVLAAVEESAREHGRARLILECGDKQPEALAMYRSSGYVRIENFGHYRDLPSCISFARPL